MPCKNEKGQILFEEEQFTHKQRKDPAITYRMIDITDGERIQEDNIKH